MVDVSLGVVGYQGSCRFVCNLDEPANDEQGCLHGYGGIDSRCLEIAHVKSLDHGMWAWRKMHLESKLEACLGDGLSSWFRVCRQRRFASMCMELKHSSGL